MLRSECVNDETTSSKVWEVHSCKLSAPSSAFAARVQYEGLIGIPFTSTRQSRLFRIVPPHFLILQFEHDATSEITKDLDKANRTREGIQCK